VSGKSRHGKGKQPPRSKRRKTVQRPVVAAQAPAQQAHQEVVSPPQAAQATPRARVATAEYPYIAGELRRIGILAGAVLVILVVLALVLS